MKMKSKSGRIEMAWLSLQKQKEIDGKIAELKIRYNSGNPFTIAKAADLDVNLYDFGEKGRDIMGAIVFKGDKRFNFKKDTILINKHKPERNQFFTLAHELGHYFLNHSKEGVLFRIDFNSDEYSDDDEIRMQELEANYFAGALLMPKKTMLKYKDKLSIKDIADALNVSQAAVATRIAWLERNKEYGEQELPR
ncbi:ImmA/IrrE family metallo-endopeptidase [Candidatus Saccharibacteria bacterium]|nr:ImmA/IrrE family metallo-endopeptidase [Candidatus Saccharibacteria bacterium]